MSQASRHATYSANLNTEVSATFMFLPVWGQYMVTNPGRPLFQTHHCFSTSLFELEPPHVPTLATTIHNPALTRKYLSLSSPGTYKLLQSGTQL
eukprot:1152725-Pelagomonas_calceolata.AAC.1